MRKKYINDLVAGIQPKFDSEVAELQKLKLPTPMILTPKYGLDWPVLQQTS